MTRVRFLVIGKSGVDLFQTSRILERYDCFSEIDAVLAKILGGFAAVPFVLHALRYRISVVTASDHSAFRH
jgi:hypothetical protein